MMGQDPTCKWQIAHELSALYATFGTTATEHTTETPRALLFNTVRVASGLRSWWGFALLPHNVDCDDRSLRR
jgi:hypothetical protein